jgi:hypothetical protein
LITLSMYCLDALELQIAEINTAVREIHGSVSQRETWYLEQLLEHPLVTRSIWPDTMNGDFSNTFQ